MDYLLSSSLAKRLDEELICHIETRVATSGEHQLIVATANATCLVRQSRDSLVISPMLSGLGKYVKDGDDYPTSVECAVSENALVTAIVPYIETLEYYTDSLRKRQLKVKGDYASRQAVSSAMQDANGKLKDSNYGTDLFGKAKTWQVSAEVVDGNRVSMYIDCSPEVATAIVKEMAKHD